MPTTRRSLQKRSTQQSDEEEGNNDTPTAVAVTQIPSTYRDGDDESDETDSERDGNENDDDSSEVVDSNALAVGHSEVVDPNALAVGHSNWSNYKNERKNFLAKMATVAVEELVKLNDLSLSNFDYEDAKIIALLSTGKLHSSDLILTNSELFCN